MLVEQIKKDMVQAMKDKDIIKRDILRVLRGELQRNFITEDVDAIKTIKKMVSNMKETSADQFEIDILEEYLPQQMTRDELSEEVASYICREKIDSIREMGRVMGYFKKNHAGLYDGKELSTIVKSLLV